MPTMQLKITILLSMIIAGTRIAAAAEANDPATLKGQLSAAWKQVQALDHPLLKDAAKVEPEFASDAQGLKSAGIELVRNANWVAPSGPDGKPRVGKPGPTPTAIDAQKPYLWITVSLWRTDVPSQPTVKTVGLTVDGTQYNLLVTVVASDAALAKKVETILNSAFKPWREKTSSQSGHRRPA